MEFLGIWLFIGFVVYCVIAFLEAKDLGFKDLEFDKAWFKQLILTMVCWPGVLYVKWKESQ